MPPALLPLSSACTMYGLYCCTVRREVRVGRLGNLRQSSVLWHCDVMRALAGLKMYRFCDINMTDADFLTRPPPPPWLYTWTVQCMGCIVNKVQIVLYTMYSIQCTMYCVYCIYYTVQWSVSGIRGIVLSLSAVLILCWHKCVFRDQARIQKFRFGDARFWEGKKGKLSILTIFLQEGLILTYLIGFSWFSTDVSQKKGKKLGFFYAQGPPSLLERLMGLRPPTRNPSVSASVRKCRKGGEAPRFPHMYTQKWDFHVFRDRKWPYVSKPEVLWTFYCNKGSFIVSLKHSIFYS